MTGRMHGALPQKKEIVGGSFEKDYFVHIELELCC